MPWFRNGTSNICLQTTIWEWDCHINCAWKCTYHIVPGKPSKGTHIKGTIKRGWVVAQRRNIDGSTTPMQASTLDAKTTEPPCNVTSPVLCQHQPDNEEKSESRWIYRLVCCLQCANVVLQVKNSVNEATDYRTITLCQWTYFRFTAQLRTYLVWWAVTWETLKTTYLSKLKGGYVDRDGRLHRTIQW